MLKETGMPHIRALFIDAPRVRNFLRIHKTLIRKSIANILGYPEKDVALIPNRIPEEDVILSDNLLPLEFVIDSGTRALNHENEYADKIRDHILERCSRAREINFGVWIISHSQNGFAEYKKPPNPHRAYRQLERKFGHGFNDRHED